MAQPSNNADFMKIYEDAYKAASLVREELRKGNPLASSMDPLETAPQSMPELDAQIKKIAEEIPSVQTQNDLREEANAKRTLLDTFRGQGLPMYSMVDDQQAALSRLLQRRNREDTEEARASLMQGLVESASETTGYTPDNFLYDQMKINRVDEDAATALQTWAMLNLHKKYESPEQMVKNIGADIKHQTELRKRAMELFAQRSQDQKVRDTIRPVFFDTEDGAQVLYAAPRFDKQTNKQVADASGNALERFIYNFDLPPSVMQRVQQGYATDIPTTDIQEALGDPLDVARHKTNLFYSMKDRKPSELYVPMNQDRFGRFYADMAVYENGIRVAAYRKKKRDAGYEGTIPPREVVEKLSAEAKAEARQLVAPLKSRNTLVAFRDPYGAAKDYTEGVGFRADVVKALQIAANVVTLGADKLLFDDFISDYIKLAGAVTLPRSSAGILMSEDFNRGYVREGDFFAPLLGEYAPTTFLDALVRLSTFEPIAATFTLANDDYAESGGSFYGRPGGVARNFLELMDSDRAIRRIAVGDKLSARFMNEVGDVFINPLLGEYGKNNPTLGRAAGMIGGLIAYTLSPDALMGIGVAARGVRPAVRGAKRALGAEYQQMTASDVPLLSRAIELATEKVGKVEDLDTDQMIEFNKVLRAEFKKSKTGGVHAYDYLAQFKATSDSSLNVPLTSGAGVEEALRFYKDLATKAREQFVSAQKKLDKINKAGNKQTAQRQRLTALQQILTGARQEADALEALLKTQRGLLKQGTRELSGMRKMVSGMKLSDDAPLTPTQIFDALRVKTGLTDIKSFALRNMDKTGKVGGVAAKSLTPSRLDELIKASMPKSSPIADALKLQVKKVQGLRLARQQIQDELSVLQTNLVRRINKEMIGVRGLGKKAKIKPGETAVGLARVEAQVQKAASELDKKLDALKKKYDKAETERVIGEQLSDDTLARNVYISYINNLRDLTKGSTDLLTLPPSKYEELFEQVGPRMRKDLLAEPVRVASMRAIADEAPRIADMTDEEFVDTVLTAKGLVNLFREPLGYVRMTHSQQALLWQKPLAWAVHGTVRLDNMIESFPVFRTNVRYLDIQIRRDADEAAKGMARVAQDVIDTMNLAVNNVRGVEAKQEAINLILTSVGRLDDLEYRYNVPLTPKAKITMTALAGFDKSLASTMVEGLIYDARMRKAAKGADRALFKPDDSLGPAITALIRDDSIVGAADFYSDLYPRIQSLVDSILLKNADTLLQADGETAMAALRNAIVTALRKVEDIKIDETAFANVKFSKAIVLGALQTRYAAKWDSIFGARFNETVGRSMNRMQGRGTEASTDYIPVTPTVGSYVILRQEMDAWNALVRKSAKASRTGLRTGKKREQVRSVLVEDKLSGVLGRPSRRINKIEDGMAYFNTDEPPVKLEDVFLRDTRVSMLDALDGFSLLGSRMMTTMGREKMRPLFGVVRDTYQRMVISSVDEAGNVLMTPRGSMVSFHNSLDKLSKEFGEQMSEAMLNPALYKVGATAIRVFNGFISFFKRHILYGLLNPRVAYFSNMHFGEYAQMADAVGPLEALPLSMQGALGSFPVAGKSLQNSYYAMSRQLPPGKIGLPTATAATFNGAIDRILRMSDETLYVGKDKQIVTGRQFYAEAMEDGVGEFLRGADFGEILEAEARRQIRNNPNAFFKVYDTVGGYQRILELKIREVTRRQRLLLYAHLRINRELPRDVARRMLLDSMYDWSFSVGRLERAMLGDFAFFYTLVKNGFAQQYRMLFEASSDESLKAYLAKYARGQTKVQRMQMISRFQSPYAGYVDPYDDLTPQQQRDTVGERNLSSFFADYPLISSMTVTPRQYRRMIETAGFGKQHVAFGMPKATTVEFAHSTANIAAYTSAILMAGMPGMDSVYSVNTTAATTGLIEELADSIANPIYGQMAKAIFFDARRPKSPYGRVLRPGDLAAIQTLQNFGLDFLVEVNPDSKDPRVKRLNLSGPPIMNELLFSILRTELLRSRTALAIAFPDLTSPEIKALANDDPRKMRLYNIGNTINIGRTIFYNGENNQINDMKTAKEAVKLELKKMERQASAPLIKD
jgi:hypothetical protein